jgi:hypothetical protein
MFSENNIFYKKYLIDKKQQSICSESPPLSPSPLERVGVRSGFRGLVSLL